MSRLAQNLQIAFLILIAFLGLVVLGFKRQVPQPEPVIVIAQEMITPYDNRQVEHVVLHTDNLGDIGLVISFPNPLPAGKLPVLILLGGLGTGENNIHYLTGAGNNIVIGYDWPFPAAPPSNFTFLFKVPALYNNVMNVPGQIASGIEWAATQPWADEDRISILGFSLGAMATPAVQDLVQQSHTRIHSTIIAYGGAPLGAAFAADTHINPAWMRNMLAPIIGVLLRPIDPTTHMQNLEGSFLILEGKDDDLIPEKLRARIRDEVPQPKTIVDFEGNHMGVGPDKNALLEKIINTSREWLVKEEAVNPL